MFEATEFPFWMLLASILGLLAPVGLALSTVDDDALFDVGLRALMVIFIALAGYAATGFALHFGGVGILIDSPGVSALVWEWTPLRSGELAHWGVAGWMGFGLRGVQTPLAALLFLAALPQIMTASLLALQAMAHRLSLLAGAGFATIMALALAPLVGNWTQAGGWLMHLGESIGAGQGYLDFGGDSFFVLAGGVAMALLLFARPQQSLQTENDVSLAPLSGAGLLLVGGVGWILASPLHVWGGSSPAQAALNALLALAAGGLIGLVYSWGSWAAPDAGWSARAAVAGWVAVLAALPWLSPLQAMLIGAIAAWAFILTSWLIDDVLSWQDPGHIIATFAMPALWGLLTTPFFAPAAGQFKAQLIGVVSILLVAFFAASLWGVLVSLFRK